MTDRPSFMDTYGNPFLTDGLRSCGCLHSKGRPCRLGREILAEQATYRQQRELATVLTDDDLTWLAEHGWTP